MLKRMGNLKPAINRMTAPKIRTATEGGGFTTRGVGLRCKEEVKDGKTTHTGFMGGATGYSWHELIMHERG
jgi:hypothetical protein